jgi:hypothetical protein
MFAVVEDFIDQESGEHGEDCKSHRETEELAIKDKRAFEVFAPDEISYSIEKLEDGLVVCTWCDRDLKEGICHAE